MLSVQPNNEPNGLDHPVFLHNTPAQQKAPALLRFVRMPHYCGPYYILHGKSIQVKARLLECMDISSMFLVHLDHGDPPHFFEDLSNRVLQSHCKNALGNHK